MSQLYFEDVKVDDEIPEAVKVSNEDMAIDFFGRDNPTNPAFSDAEAGRRMGLKGALVPGHLKMSWLTQHLNSWAGQEGRVRSLRVALRRPDVQGVPLTIVGRVVDTRREDDKNIVELEMATLANGEPSVRANATVELPSR